MPVRQVRQNPGRALVVVVGREAAVDRRFRLVVEEAEEQVVRQTYLLVVGMVAAAVEVRAHRYLVVAAEAWMVVVRPSAVASLVVAVVSARCFWLASLELDGKPMVGEVVGQILAHLASLVGAVAGVHLLAAPYVPDVVAAGHNQEYGFDQHEAVEVVGRHVLELAVVQEHGRLQMEVVLRVWIHGLQVQNRRWRP